MTREIFAGQLQELRDEVMRMSALVSEAISQSADALRLRDIETAEQVVAGDSRINQCRWHIEQQALVVIATQSPMATDLRTVSSVIHITSELERIADHAVCIARIAIDIAHEPFLKPLIDLPRMAELCVAMLAESMAAFESTDAAKARSNSLKDSDVGALYDQINRDLLVLMTADSATIIRATPLLRAAHNLERIADRVTNICKRVVFTATGVLEELPQPA